MCRDLTRRGFLVGCSAAIAGLAGSRFSTVAFGDPGSGADVLVVVFLRGGLDGLSLVPPIDGPDRAHYEAARPRLRIPVSGPGAASSLDGQFGLHPAALPLMDLWTDGRLAVVHACGMLDVVNRSHFDAMQFVELGTPGRKTGSTGWLTRHLRSSPCLTGAETLASMAVGALQPVSLLASLETVNVADPASFDVDNGPWMWRHAQRTALRAMYERSSSWLHDGGIAALDAIDVVGLASDGYLPANGAVYPDSDFGDHLRLLAQMIKLDLGLQVATVDFGGWDTHGGQGEGSEGYLAFLLADLARGLSALYADLDGAGAENRTGRLTVVVQSEFGRELQENPNLGTEHGYGNRMLVLGGNVRGGFHGAWPGLAADELVDGTDLAVTTDYRQILSEILARRMGNPRSDLVFPGYEGYEPLGIVEGEDPPAPGIFADGFESGDGSAWS